MIKRTMFVESLLGVVNDNMRQDPAHNEAHLFRVATIANTIFDDHFRYSILNNRERPEPGMWHALMMSCFWHDLMNTPKNERRPDISDAEASAEMAVDVITSNKLECVKTISEFPGVTDMAVIEGWVYNAIRDHSFTSGKKASNIVGQILQDADRIDALGSSGIIRIMANSERLDQEPYDIDDPFGENREPSSKYLIDKWFKERGKNYFSKMNTFKGKELAFQRTLQTIQFFENLGKELGHELPQSWREFY